MGRSENEKRASEEVSLFRMPGAWATLLLVLADVLALEVSLFLVYLARQALGFLFPANVPLEGLVPLALALLLFPLGYALAGLYPGYGLPAVERMRRKVQVTFLLYLALIAWNWLLSQEVWSRSILLLAMGFSLVLTPLGETVARELLARLGLWGVPVLVMGAGKTGALVVRNLKEDGVLALRPVAFLDDDPAKWGGEVEGVRVVGSLEQARAFARQGVRYAILAMPGMDRKRLGVFLQILPFPHVILIPDLFGLESLWVSSRDLGGILGLQIRRNLFLRRNQVLKRSLDIIGGLLLFIPFVLLLPLICLAIYIEDRGPVFYRHLRIGQAGRRFYVLKFRTMRSDADQVLKEFLAANPEALRFWLEERKLKNDPRITRVGKFLRRLSLDELPQVINILLGDMSLVGPRPVTEEELVKYGKDVSYYLLVRPGLTGLWQVSGRNEVPYEKRVALDRYYVQNWSIWLDLYILARTVWVVLTRKGAY